jgi:hypothetical protein
MLRPGCLYLSFGGIQKADFPTKDMLLNSSTKKRDCEIGGIFGQDFPDDFNE